MVLIHVSVKTKEDMANVFEHKLSEIVTDARKTKGCVKYEWYRVPDSATRYIIFGEFDSEANFGDYLNSDIVKRIGKELIPLLEGKPEFKHYQANILKSS